jgi:hypothetical protein
MTKSYPDISQILARKQRGRLHLAGRSFEEKLEILDRLRENELSFGATLREATAQARQRENT